MPKSGSGGHARCADGHRQWGVAPVIGGLVAGGGWGWMVDKVKSNIQCDNVCSVCFPTVSLLPPLFLFATQYLSTFHPLFSLCFLSSSYHFFSVFAFDFSLSLSL